MAAFSYNPSNAAAAAAQFASSQKTGGGFAFDDMNRALGGIGTGTKSNESAATMRFAGDVWNPNTVAAVNSHAIQGLASTYGDAFAEQGATRRQKIASNAAERVNKGNDFGQILGGVAGIGLGAAELGLFGPIGGAATAAGGLTKAASKVARA